MRFAWLFVLFFSAAHAAPEKHELTVTIGHTSLETMAFTQAGSKSKLTVTVGGSPRTKVLDGKTYRDWLGKFRALKKKGLALKDSNPRCAHSVRFRDGKGEEIPVCYDRDLKLDSELAQLWRKARGIVAQR